MNINEFSVLVTEYINENYDGVTATSHETVKNNGIKLNGITIKRNDETVLPTIYLESYLEDYNNDIPLEEIVNSIMNTEKAARLKDFPDMNFFSDFNMVKDKLFLKIINTNENSELLNEVPHKHFLDLALVVYCDMYSILDMNATVLIRNEHVSKWKVSKKDVIDAAYDNTRRSNVRIKDLLEIAKEAMEGFAEEKQNDFSEKMFVMTNENMLYGAVFMTFDDKLDSFINNRWKGVYIIPSSIHEVIILPDTDDIVGKELNKTISQVNKTCLSREEILSENAYYYSVKDGYSIV